MVFDFKPGLSEEKLLARLPSGRASSWDESARCWRLGTAARALLEFHGPGFDPDGRTLAGRVKNFPLALDGPRPVAEAISSAGGVLWTELDDGLMLTRHPGIFVAGEMIDWEAPTGGYLLQGCFATGTRRARDVPIFGIQVRPAIRRAGQSDPCPGDTIPSRRQALSASLKAMVSGQYSVFMRRAPSPTMR